MQLFERARILAALELYVNEIELILA